MHLFLSPHFDDAVLSCAGTIHRLTQRGERVIVRTVMGGSPKEEGWPDTPITGDLHQRWAAGADPVAERAREDENAIISLGAEAHRLLAWTDCIYRTSRRGAALYTTEESLFGAVHPDDIAGQLLPTLVLPPSDVVRVIYAPLAAGGHVDHQIVRGWALELAQQYPWMTIKFYEDYPYSQTPGAVDTAKAYFDQRQPAIRLGAQTVHLNEANMSAKVRAVACYRSQISTFWDDEGAMEAAIRGALARVGGGEPAERFWVIVK